MRGSEVMHVETRNCRPFVLALKTKKIIEKHSDRIIHKQGDKEYKGKTNRNGEICTDENRIIKQPITTCLLFS